jgi:cytochrome c-type biogenesis protein CcsB
MIYIAWATILSGIIFSKKSLLTLAATAVVSGLLLMVAHLNWLDPEISNLVPVLKSYWLMIHVAIITASYGFLSLGAILGLIALWLIIFTTSSNKSKLKNTLAELTIINEKTLEIGLFMLAIGTFLGGVWANESWGRYWGWDPKETWALVSVLIYTFVLHMRFIPSLRNQLVFNAVSMFAIWTIIMTYFGVNYYLSGLHSYAAGDPMPIPVFVYYLLALMIVTAILARVKFKKHY